MNKLNDHIAITSCYEVTEMCKPLEQLNIDVFIYGRQYKDNTRIFLSNNAKWNAHYIDGFYKLSYLETYQFETHVQNDVLLSAHMYPNNAGFRDANTVIGMQHGIAMPTLYPDYKEFIYFASNNNEPIIFNYYLHHLDLLKKFIAYFREQARDLIIQSEKHKLIIPQEYLNQNTSFDFSKHLLSKDQEQEFLSAIESDNYNAYPLTPREIECFYWMIQGKSAEEIGIIIGISRRTVEKYIESMKVKYNCAKVTQLIYQLTKRGLINFGSL